MTFKNFYSTIISEAANEMQYRELLAAASITMRQKYPFFDDLFRRLTVISVKNFGPDASEEEIASARQQGFVQIPQINTMAVDAKGNIYINVDFATERISYQQVIGVLCHEVMHVALHHMARSGNRDHTLHNIATDLVINHQLNLDGIPLPEMGIVPDKSGNYTFEGEQTKSGNAETVNVVDKSSEEVYAEIEALLKDPEANGEEGGEPGEGAPGGPGEGLPQPLDQHIRDDSAAAAAKEQGADPANMTESELKREIQQAANEARRRGTAVSGAIRSITSQQQATIDWKAVLRRYMSQEMRRTKPGSLWDRPARMSQAIGTYMPTKVDKPVPSIELIAAVDVSGSVSPQDFDKFYAELQKLARTFRQPLEILYWDMEVTDSQLIDSRGNSGKKSAVTGIVGGGGTEITSVKRYLDKERRKPKLVVYLTDGWVEENPEFVSQARRLFILTHNGSDNILNGFGETVKMLT